MNDAIVMSSGTRNLFCQQASLQILLLFHWRDIALGVLLADDLALFDESHVYYTGIRFGQRVLIRWDSSFLCSIDGTHDRILIPRGWSFLYCDMVLVLVIANELRSSANLILYDLFSIQIRIDLLICEITNWRII